MEVKVEVREEENWRRVLTVEVPAEDVDREYDRVAKRVAKTISLPGFRKGKVPATVVRKSFKKELNEEFLESVVPKAFGRALAETGIDPISEPKFEDLSFGESRPLSFTADFECRPKLELAETRGLEAEKRVPEVTDEHVERVVEEFRKGRSTLEEVDREAVDGDVLEVDYRAIGADDQPIEGREVEGYTVELGAEQVIGPFEEALRGARAEESPIAEVPYADDYPDPLLAGSTQRYRIKVKKVQEKRFPELTDELVAEHTDLKTVDELRERMRQNLEERADHAGVEVVEQTLLEKVVDANQFDPPESLVVSLLDDFVRRRQEEMKERGEDPESIDVEKLRSENREGAARQVRRMLLLDMLAEKEEIRVGEQDLRQRVNDMARMHGVSPRKLIEELGGDRFLRRLSHEMRDKMVLAFLVENAEITIKKVSVEPTVENS